MSKNTDKISELIPREVLFGNPIKAKPRISPDGKRLAYLAPFYNVLNIWLKTIGIDDDRNITRDDKRGIFRYFWAHNNTHIVYLQDIDGNENWRLYGINLATNKVSDFTPFENVQVQIIDRNKNFPNELLIAMNKEDPKAHDVYHLDINSGKLELVVKNPGNVIKWLPDGQLNIHGAMGSTPDGGIVLMIQEKPEIGLQKFITWDFEDGLISEPLCFSRDNRYIYLKDSRQANTARLVKMAIATKTIEVIAEDSQYDVSATFIHPDTYRIQAVAFNKTRVEWLVLDNSIKEDFDIIGKLDRGDFSIVDRDTADNIWLIIFFKDNGSPVFYVYNRKHQKGTRLFYTQPDLKTYTLASMEPLSFISRDGLTIHGYITFPVSAKKKNLPMVLFVHGGPWSRDVWGYHPVVQWLANRGYICLQVNFRGSTGYGKNFLNAGDKEWGGKMHDDLVDGVNWAVRNEFADPKRIAIFGGSYGGYAALVGATFTPDLFCCAIDMVGPSNLITFIKSNPPQFSAYLSMVYKRVGNPETEEDFLKSRSPLFKVDQIEIPILIAHGANDPRVKQTESEQIVKAMKDKGFEYDYMLFLDEGHGIFKHKNQLMFTAEAEKFLAKSLGGRVEQ